MFVRPHHFQQFDRFVEARGAALAQSLSGFAWGLVAMEFREDLLANYVFEVTSIRAVLPDGTLVDVPGNARLPSRNLDPGSLDLGEAREVLLGVRRLEERRPLTLAEGPGKGETRCLPVEEEVFDLDVGRDPAPIEKLEYDLQLFLGNEPTQGYEVLPVASLKLTGSPLKPVEVVPSFAPPTLRLSASKTLHGIARAVVERLTSVLRDLDHVRGSDKYDDLILYQALAGCLPVLREMARVGNVHPREAYLELARLAGTLFYRDRSGRPFDDIPEYEHRDPGPGFEALRKLVFELTELIVVRKYRRIPMERDGDTFQTKLPPEVKESGTRFFLEVEAPESQAKLKTLFLVAKVSNPGRIQFLRDNALPGVATEMQNAAPQELPPGPKGTFFRLKTDDGGEWSNQILPTLDLAAFLRDCPADVKIALVLVFPER